MEPSARKSAWADPGTARVALPRQQEPSRLSVIPLFPVALWNPTGVVTNPKTWAKARAALQALRGMSQTLARLDPASAESLESAMEKLRLDGRPPVRADGRSMRSCSLSGEQDSWDLRDTYRGFT